MRYTTICPVLWNGMAIDCRGDVFSCCHMKPVKMGDINSTPLKDLTNVQAIIEKRKASLEGRLDCYPDCNLIRYEKQPLEATTPSAEYDRMTYLHLNFGERCNIACIMCKVHIRERINRAILDPSALIKNVDIGPFKEVVIQGGEPLFIPECRKYLDYLGSIGKKYVLLTNGILINEKNALWLANDAMRICISVNAATKETHEQVNRGSNFDLVKKNIQILKKARAASKSELVLHGRMTLTTAALHEIPLFIKTYEELGFDRINFGYDRDTVPAFLAQNGDFTQRLRSEIREALKDADRSRIDFLRLEQLELVSATEIKGV
jgi:sulfatase maturation enzyme AslB (radical SAM superfamily)